MPVAERFSPVVLGIDPGIRGGAGLALVSDADGTLVSTKHVTRDSGHSTIQMMRHVRDALDDMLKVYNVVAVAREDHVFPQQIERIARNILRRMNGVIDVTVCDQGFIEGETYFGFPVGTWKVLAGMPGDLGKETKGAEKGVNRLGSRRKKGTPEQYLLTINALLGYEHKSVDEADAHAIAKAAWLVRRVRSVPEAFLLQTPRVQESLWDRDKSGSTIKHALKVNGSSFGNLDWLRKWLKDYAL